MAALRRGPAIYQQIAEQWRARIQSGEWPPGYVMGSESDLGFALKVSHATAGFALQILAREGLVTMAVGQPARVRERPDEQTVKVPRGATAKVRVATPEEAVQYNIPDGQPLIDIRFGGRVATYAAERTLLTFS